MTVLTDPGRISGEGRWRAISAVLIASVSSLVAARPLLAGDLLMSGGCDARYTHESAGGEERFRIEGLFVNIRKVWSDELGDRWIGVAQVDFDDNLNRIRPYQAFLQYKGPLGKWNVRAGHFLLPFGLLADYDTERLVLRGIEPLSLGIRKDTGLEFLGHLGPWDYAVALTDGLGDLHLIDDRASLVVVARIGYVQDDWRIGVSSLMGKVLLGSEGAEGEDRVSERRLALDAMKSSGPLTLRAEVIGGTDDGRTVGGGIAFADLALTGTLELNAQYALWHNQRTRDFVGLGLTYRIGPSFYARIADRYQLEKEPRHAITVQAYYEFNRHL